MTTVQSDTSLSDSLQRTLFTRMLLAREIDLEAVVMQRQGLLPGHAPTRGQEAAQVGSASALDLTTDFAFPTYRELAVAVAMGVDMVEYMATHLANWNGGTYDPLVTRLAPVNAVVGGPVLHAVGWAMGETLAGRPGVSIAYFGDGASSQGDVHEAMNFAGVFNAPVVFFCQSNGWAISLPTEQQVAGGSVAARAAGYGMPGIVVDGNDVEAVYVATRDAAALARSGGGPTVIEAITYRVGPHSTSDDPGRYRSLAEEQQWQAKDPVERFERTLLGRGVADADWLTQTKTTVADHVEMVRQGIIHLENRPGEEMFDFVFAKQTDAVARQRTLWKESTL